MQDLISRQAVKEKLINNLTYMNLFGTARSITLIDEVPSANAVKVVLCKDCIWRYHDVIDGEEIDWCGVWANETQENAFCSYGKRAK